MQGGGSYEICPCCRFEFGVTDDDRGFTYGLWRKRWIDEGKPWRSTVQPPPEGWDPDDQLATIREL